MWKIAPQNVIPGGSREKDDKELKFVMMMWGTQLTFYDHCVDGTNDVVNVLGELFIGQQNIFPYNSVMTIVSTSDVEDEGEWPWLTFSTRRHRSQLSSFNFGSLHLKRWRVIDIRIQNPHCDINCESSLVLWLF